MAPPQPGTFAHALKQRRAQLDLTQEALAELAGCAVYTVRTYEMGTRRPSRALAEQLADVLGLPADERPAFLRLARAPLAAPGRPGDPAPPAPAPERARRARLPAPPSALIGRSADLGALRARLAEPGCRLLTILGPGGVGKTRLALQLAADLAREGAEEVVWVELAPLASAAQLPAAIAEALGAPAGADTDAGAQLLAALEGRRALLVLDNFEHVVEGAAVLAAILRDAPAARLLVTSRERVRVRGEWLYELDGLALAASGPSGHSAAALLFLERARQADPAFALGPENQAAVATICGLLGGLPLGIELAAAWARALAPAAIAEELARGLDFLARADRDLPAGHRSLRAVFERSWGLLGPAEREGLARLSVFRGGCDRAAAAAVGVAPAALAALVDASLVRRAPTGGELRYTLHEVVRQYAAERLATDAAGAAELAGRHAAHFAALLEAALPALQSGGQPAALARLRPDLDNLWAAWSWAAERRDLATLRRMGRGMVTLCEDLGRLQEGARLFGAAADALAADGGGAGVGRLRGQHGYFLARAGRLAEAERQLSDALALLDGDDEGRGAALTHMALVGHQRGDYAAALGRALAAAAALRPAGDQFYLGLALCFAGMASRAAGDLAAAEAHLAESVALWGANGYPRGMLLALSALSALALDRGRPDEAMAHAARCVGLAAGQRDRWGMALALTTLGAAGLAQGDRAEAAYLFREAAEAARELGDRWVGCLALLGAGRAAADAGDGPAAARAFAEVVAAGLAAGLLPAALAAAVGLAPLVAGADRELALLALAAVAAHPAAEARVRAAAEALWRLEAARAGEGRAAEARAAAAAQPLDGLLGWLAAAGRGADQVY